MKITFSLKHTVSIVKRVIMELSSLSSLSPPIDGSVPTSGPIPLRIIMIIASVSIVVAIIGTIIIGCRRPEHTQLTTVRCTAVDVETTTATTTAGTGVPRQRF